MISKRFFVPCIGTPEEEGWIGLPLRKYLALGMASALKTKLHPFSFASMS